MTAKLKLLKGVFVPADTADVSFRCPPELVLNIPVPPSVNKTRKIDWANYRAHVKWMQDAKATLMLDGAWHGLRQRSLTGRFEITITLDERFRLDLDNPVKQAIDFVKAIGLVVDDHKQYLRKITVQWGEVPAGCRIVLKGVE